MSNKNDYDIQVSGVQPISPHNEALYEAGKSLLVESLNTGREFCKFMITTCSASIPIYLGLLKIVLPENYKPTVWIGIGLLTPAVCFLIATIVSIVGYFPGIHEFSVDLVEDINTVRTAMIDRRHKFSIIIVALFVLAVLAACTIAISALTFV